MVKRIRKRVYSQGISFLFVTNIHVVRKVQIDFTPTEFSEYQWSIWIYFWNVISAYYKYVAERDVVAWPPV